MKLIRPRSFVVFALLCLSAMALLHTSQNVRRAEEKLSVLQASIQREKEQIQTLRAEWEYLNRPERLEKLAAEFLDLVPPATDHLLKEGEEVAFPAPLPQEDEGVAQSVSLSPSPQKSASAQEPAQEKVQEKTKVREFGAVLEDLQGEGAQ